MVCCMNKMSYVCLIAAKMFDFENAIGNYLTHFKTTCTCNVNWHMLKILSEKHIYVIVNYTYAPWMFSSENQWKV